MYLLKKLWRPEIFQGKYKKKDYFEGWYFKLINEKQDKVLGVIPGISYTSSPEEAHAFIQVIDGVDHTTHYFTYSPEDFKFSTRGFEISIGQNFFSQNHMVLSLEDERLSIRGNLRFHNVVPFPTTPLLPGIMGPFSFIPFMECYHGVVNIHHDITGNLIIGEEEFNFDGGYGYIEKDWGTSFPEAYIWLQSNHFPQGDVSVMFSLAKIPWLGRHFIGHISFLRIGEKFYRFTTYSSSKLTNMHFTEENIEVTLEDKYYRLTIIATASKTGMLKAPQKGLMHREVLESVTSKVQVILQDQKGDILFQGNGRNTGLEMVGDLNSLKLSSMG